MKVPLSWLREFVEITLAPPELAHLLTMAGLEIAELTYIGIEGAELVWDREKIVIASILEVKAHPNADRLVLAEVDYGYGEARPHTVVTGAPNLFPYRDQGRLAQPLKGVLAHEGVRLYDGHKEGNVITALKGRPVRGIMSDAMLCSEKELGISEEHEGIILLEPDAPQGMPAADLLGDVIFTIDLTPNLARCLSVIGIAREIAGLTDVPLRLPDPQVVMDGAPIAGRANVTLHEPELCPRFTLGLIEGVTLGPSPQWMQRRLRAIGMRPINVIVDISNYVMFEWGQPTHAFDADQVAEQHIIVRLAEAGETVVTLDAKERDLTPYHAHKPGPLLIADSRGPLGLAGIMGGASSEVGETTTRILFEAATWEPAQIRRTAQHFKLPSEASRRFERGVDIELPVIAQRRCLELMRNLAGGTVAQGLIDLYPVPRRPFVLDLPPGEVRRLLGIQLSAHQIADYLARLGYRTDVIGAIGIGDVAGIYGGALDPLTVRVAVPSFRLDVHGLADLCEDVARVHGYEQIPPTMMSDTLPYPQAHATLDLTQHIRDMLTGTGLSEVITYALLDMAAVARINPADAVAAAHVGLANAMSPEREYLRRSLLPTLLDALALNMQAQERTLIFEIGRVFLPRLAMPDDAASWLPDEPQRLGLALAGSRTPLGWHGADPAELDFFDLKGVIEVLLASIGLAAKVRYIPISTDPRLHPGRAAQLVLTDAPDGPPLGIFGELHPDVIERCSIQATRAAVAELDLDALLRLAAPQHYRPISRYPASLQDLAVIVDEATPAAQVTAMIRRGAGDLLEHLTLFDVYTGPQIGAGKRSLAYRLSFRSNERTLTDEALAKVRGKIVRLLETELGAGIRE
ncbi:MAG: phenylalanine--tRNA ligase subunit beta [Chloroflexaceae bacterium]|nr:phenylalanine--tRNA ligase subunit beta [Chloroflexaceae bacterium]